MPCLSMTVTTEVVDDEEQHVVTAGAIITVTISVKRNVRNNTIDLFAHLQCVHCYCIHCFCFYFQHFLRDNLSKYMSDTYVYNEDNENEELDPEDVELLDEEEDDKEQEKEGEDEKEEEKKKGPAWKKTQQKKKPKKGGKQKSKPKAKGKDSASKTVSSACKFILNYKPCFILVDGIMTKDRQELN